MRSALCIAQAAVFVCLFTTRAYSQPAPTDASKPPSQQDLRRLGTELDKLDGQLKQVQGKLGSIQTDMGKLEAQLKNAPAELASGLKKQIDDLEREEAELKKQRAKLERKAAELKAAEIKSADIPRCCGLDIRTIAGFEQSGAANAASNQSYFLDLFLSQPFPWTFAKAGTDGPDGLGPRWRYFGEVRLTSVPQQIGSSLIDFTTSFSQLAGSLKPTELAQSAEFLAGLGYRLTSFRRPFRGSNGPDQRIGIYPMLMGGASGVIGNPPTPQVFEAPGSTDAQADLFKALFNSPPLSTADMKQYVGIVEKDSSRYKKQYWGGFRFVTNYVNDSANRAAARLDLLVGQNEAVTGGGLNGPVVRAEGFLPFDFGDSKISNVLYFFGNVQLAVNQPFDSFALDTIRQHFGADRVFLNPALNVLASDPHVTLRNTNPLNRDFYRIGVGMDLLKLIQNFNKAAGAKAATLEVLAGDKQKVVIGTKLRTALRVQAFDASHKIVPAASITWTSPDVADGKPTCVFANGKTAMTDTASASAIMEVSCTANSTAATDSYPVSASANGNKVDFAITNVNLTSLKTVGGDHQDIVANQAFPVALQVEADDDVGPVSGVKVTFSVPSASATFDPGVIEGMQSSFTVNTDDKGRATASTLTPKTSGAFDVTVQGGGAKATLSFKPPQSH